MDDRNTKDDRAPPPPAPLKAAGSGGGRQRQSVGEAFAMSLIRQIARSLGAIIVRAVLGRRR